MFDKVLIANRGEIAVRIMRTCSDMGVRSVAIYSDIDKGALHVEMADEAYLLGSADPADSYLNIDKIIDIAKKANVDAVHPGYGFLSENTKFAKAVQNAGMIFIGPSDEAISAMGDKSTSKKLMEKAGVPLVPGYHGDNQDIAFLKQQALEMGYPVLIKASAGGGGKGMRVVENNDEFEECLASAKREAQSSFGNDHVLVEKFVKNPRHVEIQVFGDNAGNIVYLFERDCSIQRRHQKIVEEAPAPNMSDELRKKMGKAACDCARAINYVGAGTVEFLLEGSDTFYFMEMNTRLQVEHPVTEMITGQDLVEWQLLVANGEDLPMKQEDLSINGWAMEVRLYAEDPDNDFLPAAGEISYLRYPFLEGENEVRVDSAVRETLNNNGDIISVFYDPMMAKIIVHGRDRKHAIDIMKQALLETRLSGLKTNLPFLRRVIDHPEFIKANVNTQFVDLYEKQLLNNINYEPSPETLCVAALGVISQNDIAQEKLSKSNEDRYSPWSNKSGWRHTGHQAKMLCFIFNDVEYNIKMVDYRQKHNGILLILPNGDEYAVQFSKSPYDNSLDIVLNDFELNASITYEKDTLSIMHDKEHIVLRYIDSLNKGEDDSNQDSSLMAPMPGRVIAIHVEAGSQVEKGQPLIIVEAMKMEHTISSPVDGVIEAVNTNVGEQVDDKAELISFC